MKFIGRISFEKPSRINGELVRPVALLEYNGQRYGFLPSTQKGQEKDYSLYRHDLTFLNNVLEARGSLTRELEERDESFAEKILDLLSLGKFGPSSELTENLIKMLRLEEN